MLPARALRPGRDQPNPVVARSNASSRAASRSAPMNAWTAITRNGLCGRPRRLAAVAASAVPSSSRITSSDSTWRSRSALARDRNRCRATVRAPSANAVSAAPRNGAEHATHTDPISSRPERTATTMRPVKPMFGVLGDEQRIVGGHQMRENATGIEECAQLLRRLSFDDGRHPRRVGVLLQPRIRQHPRQPVFDDDRATGRFSQAVGQREEIRWATAGFGFAAFQHQAVDDCRQLAPRHRRVNHHHRDALVHAVECGVVVAAADQHDNRPRGGCPAHRLFDRAGTDTEQHVTDDRAILGDLMQDDAAQLG